MVINGFLVCITIVYWQCSREGVGRRTATPTSFWSCSTIGTPLISKISSPSLSAVVERLRGSLVRCGVCVCVCGVACGMYSVGCVCVICTVCGVVYVHGANKCVINVYTHMYM